VTTSASRGSRATAAYESHLLPLDRIADLLAEAGLVVTARLRREPGEDAKRPHAVLLAHKPG
jgi:hypothetical protein